MSAAAPCFLRSDALNLADPSSCAACGLTAAGDKINVDPKLGPLQDYDGSTWTLALRFGSPAIDAGRNNGCPATDQRGVTRRQGAHCDIGAYEAKWQSFLPPVRR